MLVHIHGPNFKNLGDELMVRSIVSALGREYDFSLWHAPSFGANPNMLLRQTLGFKAKLPYKLGDWLPAPLRKRFQSFKTHDIDAIFDCSGYRYSTHRGWILTNGSALSALRWQRSGKPFIFLPQAFGPFSDSTTRAVMKRVFKNSALVFARDSTSYGHVVDLVGEAGNIRQCPDITHDYDGFAPHNPEVYGDSVCISPNRRMVEKTPSEISTSYMKFMKHCISRVHAMGFKAFMTIHEPGDFPLARELADSTPWEVPIHNFSAPTVKGVIRHCRAVFSSRFHILIDGLSQGVPCLATSWAHKYERLFDEYGCRDLLTSPAESIGKIDELLERILMDPTHGQFCVRIRENAARHREKVRGMWRDIESVVATSAGRKLH